MERLTMAPTEYHWNALIVFYLFTAGVSAGAFFVSGLATYLGGERYKRISRIGALIAPWPVMLGLMSLIFDLTKPLEFWWLFLTVQYTSPMSIGAWLLTLFTVISLVYFVLWFPRPWRDLLRLPQQRRDWRTPKAWKPLDQAQIDKARRVVAAVGAPISIGVGMYTGVLLGAVPARPLWNTPIVAQLFLVSAISTGAAAVLLIAALRRPKAGHDYLHEERHFLVSLDVMLILVEIFIVTPFFLHQALSTWSSSSSLRILLGGPYTLLFWLVFALLGLLIPLAIEGFELFPVVWREQAVRYSRLWAGLAATLVLIGGAVLRYVIVFAGQVSHFLPLYTR
jgi:formate-dependent nitrite reductase membrane component NrfD